jgi:hypothetical protein
VDGGAPGRLGGPPRLLALRPQPERSHLGLVEVAIPAGWRALEGDLPCGPFTPDELRQDAASKVWVLSRERKGLACAAFRRGKVVDEPAFDIGLGSRLRWSALAAALVLAGALALGAALRAARA